MEEIKTEHYGSRFTDTIFKKSDGSHIKLRIMFESEISVSLNMTFYRYILFTKVKGGRNWVEKFDCKNERYHRDKIKNDFGIDDKTLYRAFYNHWNKLNPFRLFRTGETNGILTFPDDLEQLEATLTHKSY